MLQKTKVQMLQKNKSEENGLEYLTNGEVYFCSFVFNKRQKYAPTTRRIAFLFFCV